MDTGLGHGRSAVLEEPHHIDSLRNDLRVDDEVNLCVNLVVGLTAVTVALPELCGGPRLSIDTDSSVPGVCRQVEEVPVL